MGGLPRAGRVHGDHSFYRNAHVRADDHAQCRHVPPDLSMNRYVVRVGNLRRIGNPPACSVQNTSIRRITNPPQATSLHYMILALLFMLSATSALRSERKELKPG